MTRRYVIFFFAGLFFISARFTERSDKALAYLEDHVSIAQQEMMRTGIPASIKLGQALLETASGQSKLSRLANNHFGLKCKDYWIGPTYYHKDDDRNKRGKLIKSCFRSYPDARSSYEDHSDFLQYSIQYKKLFKIPNNDYKAWARGLKKGGYATDPRYTEKLIALIERYNLTQYDNYRSHEKESLKTTTVRPTDTRPPASLSIPAKYERGSLALPNRGQ